MSVTHMYFGCGIVYNVEKTVPYPSHIKEVRHLHRAVVSTMYSPVYSHAHSKAMHIWRPCTFGGHVHVGLQYIVQSLIMVNSSHVCHTRDTHALVKLPLSSTVLCNNLVINLQTHTIHATHKYNNHIKILNSC